MMTIKATFGDKGFVCDFCHKSLSPDDYSRCRDGEPHCEIQKEIETV